jgi:hypothetical protein
MNASAPGRGPRYSPGHGDWTAKWLIIGRPLGEPALTRPWLVRRGPPPCRGNPGPARCAGCPATPPAQPGRPPAGSETDRTPPAAASDRLAYLQETARLLWPPPAALRPMRPGPPVGWSPAPASPPDPPLAAAAPGPSPARNRGRTPVSSSFSATAGNGSPLPGVPPHAQGQPSANPPGTNGSPVTPAGDHRTLDDPAPEPGPPPASFGRTGAPANPEPGPPSDTPGSVLTPATNRRPAAEDQPPSAEEPPASGGDQAAIPADPGHGPGAAPDALGSVFVPATGRLPASAPAPKPEGPLPLPRRQPGTGRGQRPPSWVGRLTSAPTEAGPSCGLEILSPRPAVADQLIAAPLPERASLFTGTSGLGLSPDGPPTIPWRRLPPGTSPLAGARGGGGGQRGA